jgi:hypothetical protein
MAEQFYNYRTGAGVAPDSIAIEMTFRMENPDPKHNSCTMAAKNTFWGPPPTVQSEGVWMSFRPADSTREIYPGDSVAQKAVSFAWTSTTQGQLRPGDTLRLNQRLQLFTLRITVRDPVKTLGSGSARVRVSGWKVKKEGDTEIVGIPFYPARFAETGIKIYY